MHFLDHFITSRVHTLTGPHHHLSCTCTYRTTPSPLVHMHLQDHTITSHAHALTGPHHRLSCTCTYRTTPSPLMHMHFQDHTITSRAHALTGPHHHLSCTCTYRTTPSPLVHMHLQDHFITSHAHALTGPHHHLLCTCTYRTTSSPLVHMHLQDQLPNDKVSRSQVWLPLAKMGFGATASITAQLVAYPLDTVRRRMQVNGALVRACACTLNLKEDTFQILAMEFPHPRKCAVHAKPIMPQERYTVTLAAWAGSPNTCFSRRNECRVLLALCVLKVAAMSQRSHLMGTSMRYKSALDCVRSMLRKEGGVASLYNGARISILKTIPGAAIQFVAYDLIKTTVAMVDPTTGITPPI
eukprot:1156509-Pelagomonas_calceolata.AAC.3